MEALFDFAIVIPLYNKAFYIKQTIESVKNQTYGSWQIIVIDDDSTDDSYEITETLKQEFSDDNKFKLVRRRDFSPDKKGGSVCRNIGLKLSSSKFLLFLDADDLLLPFCLKNRIDHIQRYPYNDMYIFNVAYCKGVNKQVYLKQMPSTWTKFCFYIAHNKRRFFLKHFLVSDVMWHTSGPIWDSEFINRIGGFNEDFQRLQDPEIHTRALLETNIKLKYLMHRSDYDILHRTDDDRIVWDRMEFFDKRIKAIEQYIKYFSNSIEHSERKYLKYLQGYLILAETLAYRHMRSELDNSNIGVYLSEIDKLYQINLVKVLCDQKFYFFKKIYRKLISNKALIKMKLPGVLLILYKKVIL